MSAVNHQLRLASRPVGLPKPSDWQLVEEPIGALADGRFRVAIEYISLDPAMRGWMNDVRSYVPAVKLGEVMRAAGVGRVVESRHEGFPVGVHVHGAFGVQEHADSDGTGVNRVDPDLAALPVHLGTLGMTGMTAYFGLLDIGRPRAGETVVVSGAAGAVGMVVGQIARLKGCRVVGIAGGPSKCSYLVDELGFDAAIDYRAGDVRARLREHAPKGVDVYFDNVGGEILDDVLTALAMGARIVICGAISQYNAIGPIQGPANYLQLLVCRASMTGMLVFDYAERYPEAVRELAGWLKTGEVMTREDVVTGGVQAFPGALLKLFAGENLGKLVLKVSG